MGLHAVLPARAAADASDHVTVAIDAAPSCLDRAALLTRLDRQLGAEFQTDTQLRATIWVRALGPADLELRLQYETRSGATERRQLHGESCAAITDAAALLLAIALDPRTAAPVEQPPPSAAAARRAAEPSVATEAASPAVLGPRIGALGVFDTALMPRPSGGVAAQLGFRVGPLELRVRGQLLWPREIGLADTHTTFDAWSVDLGVCLHARVGPLQLGPCLRAEAGRVWGSTEGPGRDASSDGARLQALGAGAELRAPLAPPLWLAVGADLTWVTRRPPFEVAELGIVGRPARFGLRLTLGPLLAW